MQLIVVGSGSSGNSYVLTNGKESLVVECGLPFIEVKKRLDFNIKPIVGVVCSHEHTDHYKYAKEYELAGKKIFAPFKNEGKLKIQFEGFKIQAFPLVHSVPCYGFLISHADMGKLLFITDTEYVPQNFSKVKVNHLLCEMNYCKDLVSETENQAKHMHVLSGHMEKNTTLKFINECINIEYLETVVLCHLSRDNADPDDFRRSVEYETGIPVYVAKKDLVVDL